MNLNIKIVYALSFLRHSWFWLGTWVFYYLLFTDYAGIGLAETIMIATYFIMEIPSGAIADLLGKKRTLTLAFFLIVLGEISIAFAPGFAFLILAIFVASIGGSFNSGTQEAIVYDTLKETGKEGIYSKVVSNMQTLRLLGMAISGAGGGFLYAISPNLPFLATGIAAFIGMVLTLFLKEPKVDTEKFSWANFVNQTQHGIKQLFKTPIIKRQSLLLISISFFTVIMYEVLNDVLAVEFGFDPKQLGVLWAVLIIIAAGVSQLTTWIKRHFSSSLIFILIGGVMAVTLLVSPFAGIIAGGITLLIRISLHALFDNLSSVIINDNTESTYRATTISTFNLLKNVPYVVGAYFIGYAMDLISAKMFAFYLAIPFIVLVMFHGINIKKKSI